MRNNPPSLLNSDHNFNLYLPYKCKIIIAVITCVVTMLSSAAHAQEGDFEVHDENLLGKAKSLTFYSYQAMAGDAQPSYNWLHYKSIQKYNNQGQITEFKMFNKNSISPYYVDSYEYDQKGQLKRVKNLTKDDPSISEIEYDNEGNRIKIKTYTLSGELQNINTRTFKNKKLVKEEIFNSNPSEPPLRRIYTYDSKGNIILFKIIDRTGKLIVETTDKYDNNGKRLSFVTKDFNDNQTTIGSYVYKYFPNGKLKEESYYLGKYQSTKNVYDTMGRVLREISYQEDASNDISSDERYKYDKTDSQGNWTQRSRYNNGHRTRLEIRNIEY